MEVMPSAPKVLLPLVGYQKDFSNVSLDFQIPTGSMYGIYTYIYHKNQPNVGKYTLHGSYGISLPILLYSSAFAKAMALHPFR